MDDGRQELALAETGGARPSRPEFDVLRSQKVLDTPRTRKACNRLGLVIEDLHFRSFDSFANPGDLKEKVQLRFDHFEKRRKERLAQVLAERAKVIAQNAKKGEVPGAQNGQLLSMLENLFEKEADRLEGDLKGKLKTHGALVKESEDQLRKESRLQERETARDLRRATSQRQLSETGSKTRQKAPDRPAHNAEMPAKTEDEFREKQAAHAQQLLAEEERMLRFQAEKAAAFSDRTAVFRDKVNRMKDRGEQLQLERRQEAHNKRSELEHKITHVQARREEDLKRRQMHSEEQHLHVMDVREQKSRMERLESHRREELREHIESHSEKIEALLALKDKLLEQRRGRNVKAEASKASRGPSLKRDCLPGPGHYEASQNTVKDARGATIGRAKVPGMLDEAIKGTVRNPAPGSYETALLPNGDRIDKAALSGAKFRSRDRDTFVDDTLRAKDHIPAPGCYENRSQLSQRGTEMRRDRMSDPSLVKHSAKQFPVWAQPAADGPGPASYCVDSYLRKEVSRRTQSSLPKLARDMLRTASVAEMVR